MKRESVTLSMADGTCSVHVHLPEGEGPFPPVILAMDGFGVRDALDAVAERIASSKYVVAVPDLYYRSGNVLDILPAGAPRDIKSVLPLVMGNPDLRALWKKRFYDVATNPANIESDLGAILELLRKREDVRPGIAGIVGYCMGGNIAMRAGAIFGSQLGAVGVFHGGNIATDAPDSPHLAVKKIKAKVYVAGAIEDPSFTDEMKARLEKELTTAKVPHEVVTYQAKHGFCISDMPTFDEAAAKLHYAAVRKLFRETL